MERRGLLTAIGSVGVGGLTGCLSEGERAAPDSTTTSSPPSQSPTAGRPSETDPLVVSEAGDYPHAIRVENTLERDVTLNITVSRGGTQKYKESHTVAAQTDEVVAGLTEKSLPEDSRSVTVTATDSNDRSANVEVSVSDCLGNIVFFYGEDGALESTYSLC